MSTVGIIDCGIGNIRSVASSVERLGHLPILAETSDSFSEYPDSLILPGVGSFSNMMELMEEKGFVTYLRDYISTGRPVLGICVGMQILFEYGAEGEGRKGLGFFSGKVDRLPYIDGQKIPNVGWAEVNCRDRESSILFDGIQEKETFYFVHSYCAPRESDGSLAYSNYGEYTYCAAVGKNNVYGVQFHPEKSQKTGERLIRNFIESDRV